MLICVDDSAIIFNKREDAKVGYYTAYKIISKWGLIVYVRYDKNN